ncbi:GAF domain-containing protein [Rapidithrix thailandica]|uniref:GAF domain-containing protein n=1 Tax=Rapidithrix thailandica TaxID=413964 RepID=A0AAW9S2Q1_9BACT
MAEEIHSIEGSKSERYASLNQQIDALLSVESDLIANLANTAAALKTMFDFLWVGFYLVKEEELVLGPFQGPVACTRIAKGKGVCGNAWKEDVIYLVEDVDAFPGHIACSSLSKSEIVLPVHNQEGKVIGVLDIDSDKRADFDETDQKYLTELVEILEKNLK